MNDYGLKAIQSGVMLALRGVEVSARISGLFAETTLTQKYKNQTESNVEVSYTFPLPASIANSKPNWTPIPQETGQ
jgi:hypothetical protein